MSSPTENKQESYPHEFRIPLNTGPQDVSIFVEAAGALTPAQVGAIRKLVDLDAQLAVYPVRDASGAARLFIGVLFPDDDAAAGTEKSAAFMPLFRVLTHDEVHEIVDRVKTATEAAADAHLASAEPVGTA